MSFIDIRGVSNSFGAGDARVDVFKDIDLRIDKGEFVVLFGPSGSGKTTFIFQFYDLLRK